MKKIIGSLLVFCFGFLGCSMALYLTDSNCSASAGLGCFDIEVIAGACIHSGNKLYIPYTLIDGSKKTGSASFCDGTTYGGEKNNAFGVGCGKAYKKCCGGSGTLYKDDTKCCNGTVYKNYTKCCERGRVVINDESCKSCASLTAEDVAALGDAASVCNQQCDQEHQYEIANGLIGCCPGVVNEGVCDTSLEDMGMEISTDCLLRGGCRLNVYKVLGIRRSNQNPTVGGFFQDIVLAATTFVGTLITIGLVFSGLLFSFGSISGKDTKRAKTIMIDCFVGLLMVMGSYTIIRLIQFLATAGS